MNEPSNGRERALRAGDRVRLGGRVGVLRYLYGNGAAVVRFDDDTSTRVVPLRRLVACDEDHPSPDDASSPVAAPGRRC